MKMKAPPGCGNTATFAGEEVTVNESGFAVIGSMAAAEVALSHGFTHVPEDQKAPKEEKVVQKEVVAEKTDRTNDKGRFK